jgi:hypothetical protein
VLSQFAVPSDSGSTRPKPVVGTVYAPDQTEETAVSPGT